MSDIAHHSWYRRILVVLVLGVPFVYSTTFRDYTLSPKLMLLQLGILAGLAIVSFNRVRSARPGSAVLALLLFIAWATASTAWALDSVAALLSVSLLLTGLCLVLLVVTTHTPDDLRSTARAVALSGTGVALLGILQYVGHSPFDFPSAGLPSSTLGFRNIAAMVAVQSLPFACYLVIDTPRQTGRIAGLGVGILVGFLILTRTRGAWVGGLGGFVVVVLLILLFRRDLLPSLKSRLRYLAVAFIVAVACASLPSGLTKRGPQSIDEKKDTLTRALASFDAGGDRGRLTVWANTLKMIEQQPLAGVGAGNWDVHYPLYDGGDTVTFRNAPERPHNLFLLILSELGVVGLLLWLTTLALIYRSAWSALRKRRHSTPWLSLAAIWSLTAILGHACFSFPMERVTPLFFLWVSVSTILVLGAGPSMVEKRAWTLGPLAVVVGLVAMTVQIARFEKGVKDATESERRGKWEEVAEHTNSALQKGRFHPEVLHLHGYALNATGQFDRASSFYSDAIVRRPYDIQLLNGYAIALQNTGQFVEAESRFLSAIQIVDDVPDLYYNLGGLFVAAKRYIEATAAYEKVRNLEADSADLLFRLGNTYALAARDSSAIRVLEQARSLDPGRSDVYFVLGELYFRNRSPDEATRNFRAFLERAPGSLYARAAADRLESLTHTQP